MEENGMLYRVMHDFTTTNLQKMCILGFQASEFECGLCMSRHMDQISIATYWLPKATVGTTLLHGNQNMTANSVVVPYYWLISWISLAQTAFQLDQPNAHWNHIPWILNGMMTKIMHDHIHVLDRSWKGILVKTVNSMSDLDCWETIHQCSQNLI